MSILQNKATTKKPIEDEFVKSDKGQGSKAVTTLTSYMPRI